MNVFSGTGVHKTENTYTGDVIYEIQDEDMMKDHPIKQLIACRPILAFILRHTMSEFKGFAQEEVEGCIADMIEVGTSAVNPGLTNTVQLVQQEDAVSGEGTVFYDVRTTVVIPGDTAEQEIKLLINLEGQQDDKPGYDLSLRAIFYCCRMISSQLGVEFTNKKNDPVKYGGIKKVYSIFICPNAAKKRAGSVEEYSINRNLVAGCNNDSPRYDVMRALVVYVNTDCAVSDDGNELIRMLNDLFSVDMSRDKKLEKLQNDYDIRTTVEVIKEVEKMDAWAAMYENKGIEKGIESTVSVLKKLETPDVKISRLIQDEFHLTESEAREYLER